MGSYVTEGDRDAAQKAAGRTSRISIGITCNAFPVCPLGTGFIFSREISPPRAAEKT